MKKILIIFLFFSPLLVFPVNNWPREIALKKAKVTMYQPQTDSMKGDHLFSRVAISISTEKMTVPVFGAAWTDSKFSTDRESGTCTIYDVKFLNMRFPGIDTIDPAKVSDFKKALGEEASAWNIEFSLEELKSSLQTINASRDTHPNYKNDPPEIIYMNKPSVLVLFDGDPVFKETGHGGPKKAINTPFLVMQDTKDRSYYLFGDPYWYKSTDPVKAAWTNVPFPSQDIQKYYESLLKEMNKSGDTQQKTAKKENMPLTVVVRTKPSELIQSKGEPQYTPVQGTQLLYMSNTEDNIFMTVDKNSIYVLLSGRWYSSQSLKGPWKFVEPAQLPSDFAKIPEGSTKDIVLASVPGTEAAKEAVLDAQIPQTAAVDRKSARCEVKWDGDPKFEKIKGTELARGMNTASTVLLYRGTYYVCDNAIWFTGKNPSGPWDVATSVPDEIQKIPPDDPSYNVKYVYIYDVQPEVVYVGYTPGYMGCYVYGPTVIYGTGYPYVPFYGPYYYPRPVTYGFSMHYNPWYGWSMGFSVSYGMFSFSMGGPVGYHGGWWGPPMYHPPHYPPYNHYYGSRPPSYHGGGNTINIDNSRNIYTNRPDNSSRLVRPSTTPANNPYDRNANRNDRVNTQPQPGAGSRDVKPADRSAGSNNVFTDRNGDIYRNNNGNWQKNNGRNWENAQPSTRDAGTMNDRGQRGGFNQQEMNRQSQARERGSQNTMNRSNATRSGGFGGGGGRRR